MHATSFKSVGSSIGRHVWHSSRLTGCWMARQVFGQDRVAMTVLCSL